MPSTAEQRFWRSLWATLACWAVIAFVAFGLPLMGLQGPGDPQMAMLIAVTGVLWVPLTIWFLRRRMRREQAREDMGEIER